MLSRNNNARLIMLYLKKFKEYFSFTDKLKSSIQDPFTVKEIYTLEGN